MQQNSLQAKTRIVVVGGGAGGLELVARLCAKPYRPLVEVTLIDQSLKHVWKPLYHEVAAGTLVTDKEMDYIHYAYEKGFQFILGRLVAINRQQKFLEIDPTLNDVLLPSRKIPYDILILALGSESHTFNIPGVDQHGLFLDSLQQAEHCHEHLLKQIVLATQTQHDHLYISIVGGGATGVELAAELNQVLSQTQKYSQYHEEQKYHFQINVVEAAPRILSALPERISKAVTAYLQAHKINVLTQTQVVAVEKQGIKTLNGGFIPSDLTIWVAGIKGPAANISHDLETNQRGQFAVTSTLQSTKDPDVFIFGDSASCPQLNAKGQTFYVPPRAQAAHQQAIFLAKNLLRYLKHQPLKNYQYKDYGSLIRLSHYNVVGNLMSKIAKSLYLEGLFARLAYWSLYKKHLLVLKGWKYLLFSTWADLFTHKQRPEIKLH